ncbi:MAG: hypothetical protein C3F02_03215 [Parcubacteria group bacterium]|nr:MAG: hypothetical protein C3F02_03215 [Parcubacteria group bacterium]
MLVLPGVGVFSPQNVLWRMRMPNQAYTHGHLVPIGFASERDEEYQLPAGAKKPLPFFRDAMDRFQVAERAMERRLDASWRRRRALTRRTG